MLKGIMGPCLIFILKKFVCQIAHTGTLLDKIASNFHRLLVNILK